jgi:hypothetical protein
MPVLDHVTLQQRSLKSSGGALHVRSAGLMNSGRRFLTTDNTAAGPRELTVNGSVTPVRFRFGPPAGQKWGMTNVISAVSDNANFTQTDFGAIPGGLTNGLAVYLNSGGVDVDIFAGQRIRFNYDWATLPATLNLTTWAGPSQTLVANFNTFESSGQYVILNGDTQDKLEVVVQDDLTSLVAFRIVARYVVLHP